jgi:hypothetical protein
VCIRAGRRNWERGRDIVGIKVTMLDEGRGIENIMEGVSLFKVLCTYVWFYHNEILSYINV